MTSPAAQLLDVAVVWSTMALPLPRLLAGRGDAVDVGPTDAAYWMDRYSERFGLCRTYANEVWHYELRNGSSCPEQVSDASARQR